MRRMFSEKQIKRLIAENPAAVLEALKGQDISAKTLEQSEPNVDIEMTEVAALPEGLVLTKYYEKAIIVNNILYITLNYNIANPTENSISLTNNWLTKKAVIPSKYASKIYRADGENITGSPSATLTLNWIAPLYTKYGQYQFTPSDLGAYIEHTAAKTIAIPFAGGASIPSNSSIFVSGRVALTLF